MSQRVAGATLSRSGLPLPASGPSHSHAGPAPPWAPPASGTTAAGRGREADNFLLPGAEPGSNSQATGEDGLPKVAPSSRPTLPPKTETRDVIAQAETLAISAEHGFLLPLAFGVPLCSVYTDYIPELIHSTSIYRTPYYMPGSMLGITGGSGRDAYMEGRPFPCFPENKA